MNHLCALFFGDCLTRRVRVFSDVWDLSWPGFASNGMVLCASTDDRSTVAFVEPPAAAELGARVLMEGTEPVAPATGNQVRWHNT